MTTPTEQRIRREAFKGNADGPARTPYVGPSRECSKCGAVITRRRGNLNFASWTKAVEAAAAKHERHCKGSIQDPPEDDTPQDEGGAEPAP